MIVEPGSKVDLSALDARSMLDLKDKEAGERELRDNVERIAALQYRLWAENRRALLVVLQGMDTSGKDGLVRAVLSGINPQGVKVHSFGRPTPEELDHDFLWRVHREVPGRGEIGVFNRSHYEDVLVARVARLVPPDVIERRYGAIQEFERLLALDTGGCVYLLKIFLHISRDEQRERLLVRLTDPARNWKMDGADLEARERWDDYQRAYEIALERCSTPWAPWRILPADRTWVRNAIASRWILQALEEIDPQLPPPRPELQELVRKLR